jgi:hypothetical protein
MVVPSRCLSGRQRGRWRAKAPDPGPATTSDWPTSATATRVIAWRHQAGPRAPRPPAAGQDQPPPHQLVQGPAGHSPVRMVGGLGEQRVGLGLLLKTHQVRVHPRPRHPIPDAPQQQWKQTQRCPKGPPGDARAFACEGSCGFVRYRAGRPPAGRQRPSLAPAARCACCRRHTLRPRASTRGRAERHRSRACPQQTRHPRPHPYPLWGRAGLWLVPWTWSGQTPPRTGPQK